MLAIFDAEGVLFDAEYLPILAEKVGKEKEIWDITRRGISGQINWEDGLKRRVEQLRGMRYEECVQVADSLPIMSGAKEACGRLRAAGWKIMAISGGFTIMTGRLQKELGLDYVYSNELLFEGGRLSGVRINVDSDKSKPAVIKMAEWGQEKKDVAVIVDGANDLRLFDICGLGIAFQAQDQVKKRADAILDDKDLSGVIGIINSHYGLSI